MRIVVGKRGVYEVLGVFEGLLEGLHVIMRYQSLGKRRLASVAALQAAPGTSSDSLSAGEAHLHTCPRQHQDANDNILNMEKDYH
jgi:hypothetical protein